MTLKRTLYRIIPGLVSICFNALNFLLRGNLPPMGNACVIVEDQGRFLTVRHAGGLIVFPGGYMRWREYPDETARREVREETGLEVQLLDTIGTYAKKSTGFTRLSTLTIVYTGEVIGGSLKSSIEGCPFWMGEAELRQQLEDQAKKILDDYRAYRERRVPG